MRILQVVALELQLRVVEAHTTPDRKETTHALLRLLYPTGSFGDMLTSPGTGEDLFDR